MREIKKASKDNKRHLADLLGVVNQSSTENKGHLVELGDWVSNIEKVHAGLMENLDGKAEQRR